MSVIILSGLAWIKYPGTCTCMPVDVTTLAGRIYYLCDSKMVEDFSVPAKGKENERYRYRFGKMVGESGEVRIGVERESPDVPK